MSIFSTIKNKVYNTYKKVDRKLGGYLPGGVSPRSSSGSSSSSPSSPSSSGGGSSGGSNNIGSPGGSGGGGGGSSGGEAINVREEGPQNLGGVVVTDLTTGESVKTKYNAKGTITSQTYSSAPTGLNTPGNAPSQIGEQRAIGITNQPGNLVSNRRASPGEIQAGTGLQGNPGVATEATYTGQPPQRYNRGFGSALKESFVNSFNFGIIGSQGFGAYSKQAFFTPFEYVGKSRLNNQVGYNVSPALSFTLSKLKPLPKETYYENLEGKKRDLYNEAGLEYKGEPARLIPQRLGENIIKELEPKYQEQFDKGTTELYDYYQGRVDSGDLTAFEAQARFENSVGLLKQQTNTQYQGAAAQKFKERYTSSISGAILKIEAYQGKIAEPVAYPYIRGAGRVIETGAIIGATTFGGSGVTFATSGYLGVKTANQAVEYRSNFSQLSTGKKVIGGAALALGAASTLYTFNLGSQKFYGEWRNIIYSDLANAPAQVSGKEVFRNQEVTSYNIQSVRQTNAGVNKAVTYQRVDVYQTGSNRAGIFGEGSTATRIFDPQTEKFLLTAEPFTLSGNIPNIAKSNIIFEQAGRGFSGGPDAYYGVGTAKITTPQGVRDINFIAVSQNQKDFVNIIGGLPTTEYGAYQTTGSQIINSAGKPYTIQTQRYFAEGVRGQVTATGRIQLLSSVEDVGTTFITGSGRTGSQQYFNQLYGVGGASGVATTTQIQKEVLTSLGSSALKTGSSGAVGGVIGSQALNIGKQNTAQRFGVDVIEEPRTDTGVRSRLLPTITELGLNSKDLGLGGGTVTIPTTSTTTREGLGIIPIQAQPSALTQRQPSGLRFGQLVPGGFVNTGYYNPIPPESPGFPFLNFALNPGGLNLPSNVVRGGRRRVKYTPSYSALFFNIRGNAPRSSTKSGVGFRPITPGFQFDTGTGGGGFLKRFRNIFK